MAKHYSRRTLSSVDELDLEQAKIRKVYHSMEHHFLESLFQPEKIAFTLGSRLVKGLASGKKNKSGSGPGKKPGRVPLFSVPSGNGPGSAWNLFFKNIARSWIRWQMFNLAFQLGKKTIKCLKQKRAV